MNRDAGRLFFLLFLLFWIPLPARQSPSLEKGKSEDDGAWIEMKENMAKMHASMRIVEPSGNDDVDFVQLMLPHHQAALDMAKTELAHGKDSQMRRLAQEIVADQQSEIELMQLWLNQHVPDSARRSTDPSRTREKQR